MQGAVRNKDQTTLEDVPSAVWLEAVCITILSDTTGMSGHSRQSCHHIERSDQALYDMGTRVLRRTIYRSFGPI
jgi:hypothetical protein